MMSILHNLFLVGLVGAQQVAITQNDKSQTTFWYNSSTTHVATFQFNHSLCRMIPVPEGSTSYICVTDDYWGADCDYWGSVGWNTGDDWGYRPQSALDKKERSTPLDSFDPHVYIDGRGVPRGVPDEFKARDQVKAGFESLIPIITVNKNIDWINYIYYNQQRFVNYTRDALQGIADQLGPTSYMTFQNRIALDMILAEKGGVCKMLKDTGTCCTYIPDNTGPNGKVTLAIKKLDDLSVELKKNSGITDPWDQYFNWMTGWQKALTQVGDSHCSDLYQSGSLLCDPLYQEIDGQSGR